MHTHIHMYTRTVPLNYNFILTRVSTSGATKYFVCQMPEFPVEIQISTLRDVAFRRGISLHETWHVAFYTRWNRDFYTLRGCAH